ncbi:hypothetical protein [Mesorhizobium captivum]|uniref:hypothetical protein n=1 Tax=Mesorhizobium captivum TaxID=3072319 RepID=UPI002A23D403|nr:hypothetical protein [Mesorhizobium sp. VK23E]MDX8514522.1 hypothetical protein [Mesorhizobium sp. VK23E]
MDADVVLPSEMSKDHRGVPASLTQISIPAKGNWEKGRRERSEQSLPGRHVIIIWTMRFGIVRLLSERRLLPN